MAIVLTAAFAAWIGPAHAEPLLVTDTIAPDINCLFDKTCKVTPADAVGAIPIAGISGRAILQSRTYAGDDGTMVGVATRAPAP